MLGGDKSYKKKKVGQSKGIWECPWVDDSSILNSVVGAGFIEKTWRKQEVRHRHDCVGESISAEWTASAKALRQDRA